MRLLCWLSRLLFRRKEPFVRFIVYVTTPISGTSHTILRWGDAPADMIAIQAGAGETAVAAPTFPLDPSVASGGYVWNSATSTWAFVGMPEPLPDYSYQWQQDAARARQALLDSLWSQCASSGLTAPQIAAMAAWRQDLRAWLSAGPPPLGMIIAPPNLTPPQSEY